MSNRPEKESFEELVLESACTQWRGSPTFANEIARFILLHEQGQALEAFCRLRECAMLEVIDTLVFALGHTLCIHDTAIEQGEARPPRDAVAEDFLRTWNFDDVDPEIEPITRKRMGTGWW